MTTPALHLTNVSFGYTAQPVVRNVDFSLASGEYLAVIGPNGGGKTTLARLILGLLTPDTGSIQVLGQPPQEAAQLVGYVPQRTDIRMDFPIRALEVVLMGLTRIKSWGPLYSKAEKEQAFEALELVGAAELAGQPMGKLSGGQRQRVFLARALVCNPRLLLLDEPTASVDPGGRQRLYDLLAKLTASLTVVAISHDLTILTTGVTAVACVNTTVQFQTGATLQQGMLDFLYGYGGAGNASCPAHGALCPTKPPTGNALP